MHIYKYTSWYVHVWGGEEGGACVHTYMMAGMTNVSECQHTLLRREIKVCSVRNIPASASATWT